MYVIIFLALVLIVLILLNIKKYYPKKHLYKKLLNYQKSKYGILIKISSDTQNDALISVKSIRSFTIDLPITLYYNSNDLDIDKLIFDTIPNINFLPVHIDYQEQERMAAILNCKYKNVLVIDPNIFVLMNPELLFQTIEYKNTGAVFWLDKQISTRWDGKIQDWVREFFPYKLENNTILNRTTGTFISSSIFLLNLNPEYLSKCAIIYKKMHDIPSEKECYWIIQEILNKPYYVHNIEPCILAYKTSSQLICGETGFLSNGMFVCIQFKKFNNLVDIDIIATNGEWSLNGDCLLNAKINNISSEIINYINTVLKK